MSVDAPLCNNILTHSTSADFIAKNRTGIGTPEALGSAPRLNNKSNVAFILSFLKIKYQYISYVGQIL